MAFLDIDPQRPVKRVLGFKLQRRLPKISATFRALLGNELRTGTAALAHATPRQAATLCQVPMAYLRTVAAATELELKAMQRGEYSVEQLHCERLANSRASDIAVDDIAVDRILHEIGFDRVFAWLDRQVKPNGANGHDHPVNDNVGCGGAAMPAQLGL